MIIVLTGIDGSGKSTAARSLPDHIAAGGDSALILNNHAGRRTMSVAAARLGISIPPWLADAVETTLRVGNVLISHFRASRFTGVVIMDRHLHCQLALRHTKGLRPGRFLPWLLRALPQPAAVVHFDVDPGAAHQRILARGTDQESLADLIAFREGYRNLAGFVSFVTVDANVAPAETARQLVEVTCSLATPPCGSMSNTGQS